MGTIFRKLEQVLCAPESGSVFVEIGSDRYEGSTAELDRLAKIYGLRLISVDIVADSQQRLSQQLTNTEFVIDVGSAWALSYSGPGISCLYLDNFDYIWDINSDPISHVPTRQQMQQYAERGQVMTNQNCQAEHMKQMLALYPYLSPNAVVMFDDTYKINDCWIGKCGPAVVFLLAQGWQIVADSLDCGVILSRA